MTELLDGCGVAVRWSGSGRQCPTASLRHFSVKLVLAAPASFLPAAALSQDACASFSHFVMKLVSAAPESLFALASPLQVSAMAERGSTRRSMEGIRFRFRERNRCESRRLRIE